jgi:hypothetical protein
MNTRMLKKHLKYKIPQIRLAVLREPSQDPLPAIRTPEDLNQYLEPLKHLSDYVPTLLMCNTLRNEAPGEPACMCEAHNFSSFPFGVRCYLP